MGKGGVKQAVQVCVVVALALGLILAYVGYSMWTE